MIIYQIKLPKKQDPEAFAAFMRDEYFPAIHKGPTRVGQVLSLALLQSDKSAHEFFWHVGWGGLSQGGPRVNSKKIASKFESFGASVKEFGFYREIAAWDENDAA